MLELTRMGWSWPSAFVFVTDEGLELQLGDMAPRQVLAELLDGRRRLAQRMAAQAVFDRGGPRYEAVAPEFVAKLHRSKTMCHRALAADPLAMSVNRSCNEASRSDISDGVHEDNDYSIEDDIATAEENSRFCMNLEVRN